MPYLMFEVFIWVFGGYMYTFSQHSQNMRVET